jgi:perosamine synthetase
MKNEEVDTRPFFYPISQFPMFTEQDTPVAHHVAEQGINLPSGLMLTKKQVDFVCSKVKKVLKTML